MGSRQHKNKQGAPPTLDEFQAKQDRKAKRIAERTKRTNSSSNDKKVSKKQKVDEVKDHKHKHHGKDEGEKEHKHASHHGKKHKKSHHDDEEEENHEFPADLPEVDLEELSKAKKALFDDDEEGEIDEDLKDEFDMEQEYENDEDEDGVQVKSMFSDDEDFGEDELEDLNAANMESLSKRLDEEEAEEAEEAEQELLEANQIQPRADVLPSKEEEAIMAEGPQDLTSVRTRIIEIVKVLEDFKNLGAEGRSRTEYVDRLLKDICEYFGYTPFLAEKLFNLFSPSEALEFFEANEISRPITIRTNTLKTRRRDLAQSLVNRGVNLQPIGNWTKVGLQIFDSQVPIGATPEYLAGQYILQAASSFLPVIALDPHENERILDMAAAPGGKTTYISALMKNTGCVFANDANKNRTKSLIANIHRLGCTNTIVCNYDAREFPKVIGGFDRILLDAPCSGTGVIGKDQSVKVSRTEKDFIQIPHLQKQLLLSAIDSVDCNSKHGGVIVYSTCYVAVEEDEAVVNYALRKRPNVKLVETGLAIGKEGFTSFRGKTFHPSVKLTRRYYPHTYNVDGFFVAKFQKIGPSPHDDNQASAYEKEALAREEAMQEGIIHEDFANFNDEEDEKYISKSKKNSLLKKGINPKSTGAPKKENK